MTWFPKIFAKLSLLKLPSVLSPRFVPNRHRNHLVKSLSLQNMRRKLVPLSNNSSSLFINVLSSISTVLNTLSGVFVEDLIRGHTKWNPSEHEATWIMRIFVVVTGMLCVALVFVVAQLGTLFQVTKSQHHLENVHKMGCFWNVFSQVAFSVDALFSGAILTVFSAALLLPWVSSLVRAFLSTT